MEIIHAPHSSIDRVTPAHTGFGIFSASYIQDDPRASVWRHQHIPFYNAHDKLHTHQEHEILLVEHGTGEYVIPQETFSISPGQIVVLPSASPHDLINADGLVLRGLLIHPELFYPLPPAIRLREMPRYKIVHDRQLYQTFNELFEQSVVEYGLSDILQPYALHAIGQSAVIQFIRLMHLPHNPHTFDSASQRVMQVRVWIDRHFMDKIALSQLAEMALLSRSQFSALFQQLFHLSPMAYVQQRRITLATDLLADAHLPILAIATLVGFDTLSCFNRAFKSQQGISPSAYRKKCINNQQKSAEISRLMK